MNLINQANINLFKKLPVPSDLFRGSNFPVQRIPEEVLVFFRGNPQDAMAYGDLAQHHRFVLCFCFKTEGSVQVDADMFDLKPLEGCLIFPYQPHHFTHFEGDEIAWLFISFDLKDSDWLDDPLRNAIFSMDKEVVHLLNRMVGNRINQRGGMLPSQLVLLFEHLLNSSTIARKTTATHRLDKQLHRHANLSSVLGFIHQNLNSPIKVGDVVAKSGCSETVLRDLFEKYLNTSIAAYIRKMRVLRACHLLATSSETVGTISDRCGFSSQYIFSRTFKRVAGCSPSAYRRIDRANH